MLLVAIMVIGITLTVGVCNLFCKFVIIWQCCNL